MNPMSAGNLSVVVALSALCFVGSPAAAETAPDNENGRYTFSPTSDGVMRLDTKTGELVEYLLPRTTNIRRVFVQDGGPRPVFWAGSNHGASIVKLEPLD